MYVETFANLEPNVENGSGTFRPMANYTNGFGIAYTLGRYEVGGKELYAIGSYNQFETVETVPEYGEIEQLYADVMYIATGTENEQARIMGFGFRRDCREENGFEEMVTFPPTEFANDRLSVIHSMSFPRNRPFDFVPVEARELIRDGVTDGSVFTSYMKDRKVPYLAIKPGCMLEVRKFIGARLLGTTRMSHSLINGFVDLAQSISRSEHSFSDVNSDLTDHLAKSFFGVSEWLTQYGQPSETEYGAVPVNADSIRRLRTGDLARIDLPIKGRFGYFRARRERELLEDLADHQETIRKVLELKAGHSS